MNNYLLKIEYDGTKFVGWQFQKNGKSIQGVIEKALRKIFKLKIRIIGAGRTDKGVHAKGQYANFKIDKIIDNKKKFINSINYFLKKDYISILNIQKRNLTLIQDIVQKKEFMSIKLLIEKEPYLSIETKLGT